MVAASSPAIATAARWEQHEMIQGHGRLRFPEAALEKLSQRLDCASKYRPFEQPRHISTWTNKNRRYLQENLCKKPWDDHNNLRVCRSWSNIHIIMYIQRTSRPTYFSKWSGNENDVPQNVKILTFDEFLTGVMRMRGGAKSIDLVTCIYQDGRK